MPPGPIEKIWAVDFCGMAISGPSGLDRLRPDSESASPSAKKQINDDYGEDDADPTAAVVAEPGAHVVATAAEK